MYYPIEVHHKPEGGTRVFVVDPNGKHVYQEYGLDQPVSFIMAVAERLRQKLLRKIRLLDLTCNRLITPDEAGFLLVKNADFAPDRAQDLITNALRYDKKALDLLYRDTPIRLVLEENWWLS